MDSNLPQKQPSHFLRNALLGAGAVGGAYLGDKYLLGGQGLNTIKDYFGQGPKALHQDVLNRLGSGETPDAHADIQLPLNGINAGMDLGAALTSMARPAEAAATSLGGKALGSLIPGLHTAFLGGTTGDQLNDSLKYTFGNNHDLGVWKKPLGYAAAALTTLNPLGRVAHSVITPTLAMANDYIDKSKDSFNPADKLVTDHVNPALQHYIQDRNLPAIKDLYQTLKNTASNPASESWTSGLFDKLLGSNLSEAKGPNVLSEYLMQQTPEVRKALIPLFQQALHSNE